MEEIALTAVTQRRKLEMVLEATNRSLQVEKQQAKWSVDSTWASARAGVCGRAGGAQVLLHQGQLLVYPGARFSHLRCGHKLGTWKEAEASGRCRGTGSSAQTALGTSVPRGCHCSQTDNMTEKRRIVNNTGYLLSSKYRDEPTYLVRGALTVPSH